MNTIDTRGLSCPEPVLLTKAALDSGDLPVLVLISDATPYENVRRYAENHGYTITESIKDDVYELTICK